MSSVYQDLSELSEEERQLLEMLLAQEGVDVGEMLLRQSRDTHTFPLSVTQTRLWNMGQFGLGTALGNVPMAFQIRGPLNAGALKLAIASIVDRHEVLRTCFQRVDGIAMQTVLPDWQPELMQQDLTQHPQSERLGMAIKLAQQEAHHSFDFENEPCFRSLLITLGDMEFVLAITMNHLATDGWGARIMLRDLSAYYSQFAAGIDATLPELEVQYADYSVWHREWLDSDSVQPQIDYWFNQLKNAPKELVLPHKSTNSSIPSYDSELDSFEIPPDLSDKLREFSQRYGVTLYTTLLATWHLLLHTYTGSDDILVGTIISNRNRRELEHLVGNFGNNLLIRSSFHDNPAFTDVLTQVRDAVLDAYEHQDLPLEQLDQTLRERGEGGQLPNFKTMFILRDSDLTQNLSLPNLEFEDIPVYPNMMALDMIIDIMDRGHTLSGTLEYKSSLYWADFISELIINYRTLLSYIVDTPDENIVKPFATNDELELHAVSTQELDAVSKEHLLPQVELEPVLIREIGFDDRANRSPLRTVGPETHEERLLSWLWHSVRNLNRPRRTTAT